MDAIMAAKNPAKVRRLNTRLLAIILLFFMLVIAAPRQAQAALTPDQQTKANAALLSLWESNSKPSYAAGASQVTAAQVNAVLASGANVNATDKKGHSALMAASASGNLPCATLLVSKEADINARDDEGWTSLMYACLGSKVSCAAFLISKGAKLEAKESGGQTVLLVVAQALMETSYAADANAGHLVPVVPDQAGLMACVKLLIASGANVNARDNEGETALMLAASGTGAGNVDCVRLLLSKGAEVNATDKDGETALMLASAGASIVTSSATIPAMGSADCVTLLISKGATVNAKDKKGKSALDWAGDQPAIIVILKAAGRRQID